MYTDPYNDLEGKIKKFLNSDDLETKFKEFYSKNKLVKNDYIYFNYEVLPNSFEYVSIQYKEDVSFVDYVIMTGVSLERIKTIRSNGDLNSILESIKEIKGYVKELNFLGGK